MISKRWQQDAVVAIAIFASKIMSTGWIAQNGFDERFNGLTSLFFVRMTQEKCLCRLHVPGQSSCLNQLLKIPVNQSPQREYGLIVRVARVGMCKTFKCNGLALFGQELAGVLTHTVFAHIRPPTLPIAGRHSHDLH